MKKIKELPVMHQALFTYLPLGSESPISVEELSFRLGIDRRTVHQNVNDLIIGYKIPVCGFRSGNNTGLYIPSNDREREVGLVALKKAQRTQEKRINTVEEADLEFVSLYKCLHGSIALQEQLSLFE